MLVDMRPVLESVFRIDRIERLVRREAVEAAALHEEELVAQHVAGRLDFALVSGLAQDTRGRKAASVAEFGEVDLDQPHPVERQAFYGEAQRCFAILRTGERRFFGNIILTKGVVDPEGKVPPLPGAR